MQKCTQGSNMSHNIIRLPSFARHFFSSCIRCRQCHRTMTEADITFVGAARGKDGSICFTYDAICHHCDGENRIIDSTHQFTEAEWWNQFARWHEEYVQIKALAPTPSQPVRLVIGPPLKPATILGGYKGDIGPVIFLLDDGAARLERGNTISRCDTFKSYPLIPVINWEKLQQIPEGALFEVDGEKWQRLTRAEIEQITCDRVFTVIEPPKAEMADQRKPIRKSASQTRGKNGSAHTPKSGKR